MTSSKWEVDPRALESGRSRYESWLGHLLCWLTLDRLLNLSGPLFLSSGQWVQEEVCNML